MLFNANVSLLWGGCRQQFYSQIVSIKCRTINECSLKLESADKAGALRRPFIESKTDGVMNEHLELFY